MALLAPDVVLDAVPTDAAPPESVLRRALLALALGGFAIGTAEFVTMGLLPQIADGVGVSVPTAGHAISAYALGVVVGAPVLAGVGAKLPRRGLLIGLTLALALGNLLSALAPTYETLVGARFLAGLPHGAYFGVACLVAADLADEGRRARAVARVLLGLSVANVAGVPAATWLGQGLGWRAAFLAVMVLSVLTAVGVLRAVPRTEPDPGATLRREMTALRRSQVWFALSIGAVGGGGTFAVYSYIAPILTGRTGIASALVPIALATWGVGMVVGGVLAGRLLDWRPHGAMVGLFLALAATFALFTVTSLHPAAAVATIFLLGFGIGIPTGLQMRLMQVAGDAQTLAASLNHASFNVANALGAWLGGLVLAGGLGLAAPMWVAVGLTLAGLALYLVATALERRDTATATAGDEALRPALATTSA